MPAAYQPVHYSRAASRAIWQCLLSRPDRRMGIPPCRGCGDECRLFKESGRSLRNLRQTKKDWGVASKTAANGSCRSVTEHTQSHLFQELTNTTISGCSEQSWIPILISFFMSILFCQRVVVCTAQYWFCYVVRIVWFWNFKWEHRTTFWIVLNPYVATMQFNQSFCYSQS